MQDQSLLVASGGGRLDKKRRESVRAAVAASRADNTRTQYRSGWGLWCRWAEENGHQSLPAEPLAVAGYLAERAGRGARVATVQSARASISAAHRFAGLPDPTKHELVQAAMKGLARQHARPQRQAKGLTVADVAACLAVACVPRKLPRGGVETAAVAERRGRVDAALVGLLFQAGLRRSEAAALRWGEVEKTAEGVRVRVVTSKTDQAAGEVDWRFLKGGCARAVLALRPGGEVDPGAKVLGIGAQAVGLRLAALCKAAGLMGNYTGHSGRVGLASELVARGASTTEVQLAGGWKTSRMVARYSAAVAAERGAVAKYL